MHFDQITVYLTMTNELKKDFDRISNVKSAKGSHAPSAGYVIAYSEARKMEALEGRFDRWSEDSGFCLLNRGDVVIDETAYDNGWVCGAGIFRA